MALNTSNQQANEPGSGVGVAVPELQEARDSIVIVKFGNYQSFVALRMLIVVYVQRKLGNWSGASRPCHRLLRVMMMLVEHESRTMLS